MGHRRLSIIDLHSHSKQTMTAGCGNLIGIFNGEIYNYREMRLKLVSEGYDFVTNSDTEVLLNAYHFFGVDVLQKLIGMFAFAVYDKRNCELFIARDRLGIKPLYFAPTSTGFCFASEVKSILRLDDKQRDLNLRAVSSYLSYRYPIMNESFYDGVEHLPPGCYMRVSSTKKHSITRYWSAASKLVAQAVDQGEDFYIDEIKRIFHSAVKYRMISDVPIGAYLSGGVDSSAVVAEMARLSNNPIKTFTIGFEELGYNEFKYARIVADQYATDHHEIILSADGYFEAMAELIGFKDAPLGIPNEVPLYLMSKELKKHITVVLSGEGADEIFGGYGRIFRAADDFAKWKIWQSGNSSELSNELIGRLSKRYGNEFFSDELDHFLHLYRYTGLSLKSSILHDRFKLLTYDLEFDAKFRTIFSEVGDAEYASKMMYAFENVHLPGLLQRVDATTMAASVESRVPFVDHRLVEFAFSIPNKYKLKWNCDPIAVFDLLGAEVSEQFDTPKYILKKAFELLLPVDVLYRKKMGFPVPLHRWFGHDFRSFAEKKILHGLLVREDIINKQNVEKLIRNPRLSDDYALSMKVWMILNLEMFLGQF